MQFDGHFFCYNSVQWCVRNKLYRPKLSASSAIYAHGFACHPCEGAWTLTTAGCCHPWLGAGCHPWLGACTLTTAGCCHPWLGACHPCEAACTLTTAGCATLTIDGCCQPWLGAATLTTVGCCHPWAGAWAYGSRWTLAWNPWWASAEYETYLWTIVNI